MNKFKFITCSTGNVEQKVNEFLIANPKIELIGGNVFNTSMSLYACILYKTLA
jgi:hypothetical protein